MESRTNEAMKTPNRKLFPTEQSSVFPNPPEHSTRTSALRHDRTNPGFNPDVRQLLHVGYKVAAKMGEKYYEILRAWIADGAKLDLKAPRVTKIDVFPRDPVVQQMVEKVAHPTAGQVEVLRNPIRLSANPASIRRPPPLLGEHTGEVKAALAA